MPFRIRICQNDTTDALRYLFKATPMRIPEASVQPLLVIAEKGGKTEKRGHLLHLLTDTSPLSLQEKEDPVADLSLNKTKSMAWDFGFKILDGFFQGFSLPSADIGAVLNNAKEVSLSFKNVKRKYIDKNELGTALMNRGLQLNHPSAQIFLGEDAHNLLLVTDAIMSNGFGIHVLKTRDNQGKVKLPEIQKIINEAKLDVKAKSSSDNSIFFEGPQYLTFAFTCVKLNITPATGALAVGTMVVTEESRKGLTAKESEELQPVELDDDFFEPGMFEWD